MSSRMLLSVVGVLARLGSLGYAAHSLWTGLGGTTTASAPHPLARPIDPAERVQICRASAQVNALLVDWRKLVDDYNRLRTSDLGSAPKAEQAGVLLARQERLAATLRSLPRPEPLVQALGLGDEAAAALGQYLAQYRQAYAEPGQRSPEATDQARQRANQTRRQFLAAWRALASYRGALACVDPTS